jgi:hypothetical protein
LNRLEEVNHAAQKKCGEGGGQCAVENDFRNGPLFTLGKVSESVNDATDKSPKKKEGKKIFNHELLSKWCEVTVYAIKIKKDQFLEVQGEGGWEWDEIERNRGRRWVESQEPIDGLG